jgi:hypothetical protein
MAIRYPGPGVSEGEGQTSFADGPVGRHATANQKPTAVAVLDNHSAKLMIALAAGFWLTLRYSLWVMRFGGCLRRSTQR